MAQSRQAPKGLMEFCLPPHFTGQRSCSVLSEPPCAGWIPPSVERFLDRHAPVSGISPIRALPNLQLDPELRPHTAWASPETATPQHARGLFLIR